MSRPAWGAWIETGKTEFAKKWCDEASDRVRVSWTELLRTLAPRATKDRRVLAFEGAIHLMSEAMKRGLSVVLDEENLKSVEWGIFVTFAARYHAHVEWHAMPVDVEESKRRNALHGSPIRDLDIERKAADYAAFLKQK